MFSVVRIKNRRLGHKAWRVALVAPFVFLIAGLLAACGESGTPTSSAAVSPTADTTTAAATTVAVTTVAATTVAPTTAIVTTVAPTTAAPTTAIATTVAPTTAKPTTPAPTTAKPTTAAPTTAKPTTPAQFNPGIRAATPSAKVGSKVEIMGGGFPATTKLVITVAYPNGAPIQLGQPTTDAKGLLLTTITLAYDHAKALEPGVVTLRAVTTDGKYSATNKLTLVAPGESNPVLTLNPVNPVIGQELTISGTGFAPNTGYRLRGGVQNPGLDFGEVKTDAKGNFTYNDLVDFVPSDPKKPEPFLPGPFNFTVMGKDDTFVQSISVTVIQGLTKELDASKQFFAALSKSDDATAMTFLSDKLKARVQSGETTIGGLLGIAKAPLSTELVVSREARGFNIRATMQQSGGVRYAFLFVTEQPNGSIKISDISGVQ
jgi:hypothetical protein